MTPDDTHKQDNRNNRSQQAASGQEDTVAASAAISDAMQDQYNYYYNRIYPLLKDNLLDFPRLAGKTGLKERRIRETLLFRLTSGEVMQLFGRKNGFCYICGYKTHSPVCREPICMNCLKTLDVAIQEIHLAEITQRLNQESSYGIPSLNDLPDPEDEPPPIFGEIPAKPVEKRTLEFKTVAELEHQQNLEELIRYRAMFGPLPPSENIRVNRHMEEEEPSHDVPDSPELAMEAVDEESVTSEPVSDLDPFLQMLKLNDRDVPAEVQDTQLPELFLNGPIRHFGFERTKGSDA